MDEENHSCKEILCTTLSYAGTPFQLLFGTIPVSILEGCSYSIPLEQIKTCHLLTAFEMNEVQTERQSGNVCNTILKPVLYHLLCRLSCRLYAALCCDASLCITDNRSLGLTVQYTGGVTALDNLYACFLGPN